MPFKQHPEFKLPESLDVTIWRYMDLSKFLSLLDHSALFFVRLDHLTTFDPLEGYYTSANLQVDEIPYDQLPNEWKTAGGIEDENLWEELKKVSRQSREFGKANRAVTFVNSWHIQNHESAAMWRLYLKSDEGLAIQSTTDRLIAGMANYKEYEVHVGMMKYIDYAKDAIPMGNLLSPFLHKRKSFEHERELRALIWTPQHGKNSMPPGVNKHAHDNGLYVSVELNDLIERIYVASTAPEWFHELINSLVTRFGLNKPVLQSDLAATPLY
jgi:hypothetical protein